MQRTAKRRPFKSRSVNHKQREQSADKPLWTNFKFIPYSLAQLVLCALGTVCLLCSITTHPGYSSTFLTWLRIKHAVCFASRLIRSVSRSVEKHNILQVRHSRLSLNDQLLEGVVNTWLILVTKSYNFWFTSKIGFLIEWMKKIAVLSVVEGVIFLILHNNQSVDYNAEYVMKNCAERGECCSCLPQGRRPR